METVTNILLVHSDQHRFDCVGVNGHPLVRTPNLDRLAREGVNFTQAYTPSAICSPARASLLTGQWPHQHGCLSIPSSEIYRPATVESATLPGVLKQGDYQLGWIGKFHGEIPVTPDMHGFDVFVPESAYAVWRQESGLPELPPIEGNWFGDVNEEDPPEQTRLAWQADKSIETMDAFSRSGRPFFVRWDPFEPHPPCRPPRAVADLYPPDAIEPWGSYHDSLEAKPYIQRQQRKTWQVDTWDWDAWAPVVSRYLAEITLMDTQFGRVLDWLDETGLAESTLVIYTTDHGDLCGGHGMFDKHFVMYDDVMRVPLIARWPGVLAGGETCDAFVCNEIDIARTLCGAARATIPSGFAGKDLVALANDRDPSPREDIFASWHGGQFGSYSQRMVRDRRWKYIWNCTDVDEFYDLERDPYELTNAIDDPSVLPEVHRLRTRLIEWMEELHDPQLNAWTRVQLENRAKHSSRVVHTTEAKELDP